MNFRIIVARAAEKSLRKRISPQHAERVRQAIEDLATNRYPTTSIGLQGRSGRRIRVGDYRVIYFIDEDQQLITILQVGHRRDVYR